MIVWVFVICSTNLGSVKGASTGLDRIDWDGMLNNVFGFRFIVVVVVVALSYNKCRRGCEEIPGIVN